jgi:hypothetical protein
MNGEGSANAEMGEALTEITLVNIGDQNDARRGYIPQDQVRQLTVNAVVDVLPKRTFSCIM